MASTILVLIVSLGAIAAGWNYVRTARRMTGFSMTRGMVVGRDVAPIATAGREGRWGRGGGYQPKVTYVYVVNGVSYTGDRWSYASNGLRRSLAEQALARVPDQVDVHYDPTAPQDAYLHTHTPRFGYALVAGGVLGVLAAVVELVT